MSAYNHALIILTQASNGKTPSKNQRSSSNIYELESSISKVAFESSASLDTKGSKTPDATPDSGFAFNINMKYPQGNSGELKLKFVEYIVEYIQCLEIIMTHAHADRDVCIENGGVQD